MSSYMAKLAPLKASPGDLRPPKRPFSYRSDKVGFDESGMYPTFTAANPFDNPGSAAVSSMTRDPGASQTYFGPLGFVSDPQPGDASSIPAQRLSETTELLRPLSYEGTPESAPPAQPKVGAQTSFLSPERSADPIAQQRPIRLTPSVGTPDEAARNDPLSGPSTPVYRGLGEWAFGEPLEVGQLRPSSVARPPYDPLTHGDKGREGVTGLTASRQGPELPANVSPTTVLPIGPARLPTERLEKNAPLLTIGTIEVTVVPPPAAAPVPLQPHRPAVTVISPNYSQPPQPALAWYGMAQT